MMSNEVRLSSIYNFMFIIILMHSYQNQHILVLNMHAKYEKEFININKNVTHKICSNKYERKKKK